MKCYSTTQVNGTDDDGTTIEYKSKTIIEEVMVKGNNPIEHQADGGNQILLHTFMEQLGKHGEGLITNSVLKGTFIISDGNMTATIYFLVACNFPVNV